MTFLFPSYLEISRGLCSQGTLDLAKKNFWGFKEISNPSFKYMPFLYLREIIFVTDVGVLTSETFFNRKKSSCLNRPFSSSFKPVKTTGYLYEAFEIHEKGTSAKKVTLSDAKEDVDKICIEVTKKLLTKQVKNLRGFSLHSDTKHLAVLWTTPKTFRNHSKGIA